MTPERETTAIGRGGPALAAVLTLVGSSCEAVGGAPDYVERAGSPWFAVVGAALALVALALKRSSAASSIMAVAATVLLLPSAVLVVFHAMRVAGAIPLPVDWRSCAVSIAAVLDIGLLWRWGTPLRRDAGRPLATPRWVAWLGITTALIYPAIKSYWVLGGQWLRPGTLAHGVDGAYLFPVGLSAIGTVATLVSFRWWDCPAPRWAHPSAVLGGLTLAGLGLGGVYATFTHPDTEGVLLGFLVYGGWLAWGLTTLAVAGRLSSSVRPQQGAALRA